MFSEKKTECRVCGYRFTPERENIYTAEEPRSMADKGVLACPNCGSGEYLHNADENENAFCGQCGQAIKWGCEDED